MRVVKIFPVLSRNSSSKRFVKTNIFSIFSNHGNLEALNFRIVNLYKSIAVRFKYVFELLGHQTVEFRKELCSKNEEATNFMHSIFFNCLASLQFDQLVENLLFQGPNGLNFKKLFKVVKI